MKLHWQNKEAISDQISNKHIQSCLFQTGSLTRYLEKHCKGEFQIELKSEIWHPPMLDEANLLDLKQNEYAFIRESWLTSDNERLVYARTIIPNKTLKGKNRKLYCLGNKPLGKILFADETASRTNTQYAKIPNEHELYQLINSSLNSNDDIWGRQSLFHIQNEPLLINEVFLPQITTCIQL